MDNMPGVAFRCKFDDNWTMLFISPSINELTGIIQMNLLNIALNLTI